MKKIFLHSICIAAMLLTMQACGSGKTSDSSASSADSTATVQGELSEGPFKDFSPYYERTLDIYEEELQKDIYQGLITGRERMSKENSKSVSDAIFLTTGQQLLCSADESISTSDTGMIKNVKRDNMGNITMKIAARVKNKSKKLCLVLCDEKDQPIWVCYSIGTTRYKDGEYGKIFSLNLWIPTSLDRFDTQKGYAKLLAYVTKARLVTYNEGKSLNEQTDARAQDYYYKVSGKKAVAKKDVSVKADLGAYELMGNVKSCKWKETEAMTNTYTFDQEGHLTKVNNRSVSNLYSSLKRDKEGRLLSYTQDHADEYYSDGMTYSYDANSRMIKRVYEASDGSTISTYKYNEKGFVASVTEESNYMDGPTEKSTKTYQYQEVDSHGNWTKRSYKQDDGFKITETRIILYY